MSEITILTAVDGSLLAKTMTPTGHGWSKASYDLAKVFNIDTADIGSIDDLSTVLTMLEDLPHSCVIRGRRKPGALHEGVQRLLHDQPGCRAPFEEQEVSWLMIDIDDLPAPEGLTNIERLEQVLGELPACFRDVDFHYQWSSSAGLDGWSSLRVHLFFWLDRPIRCSHLRAQADEEGWAADLSLFNPVQVHYTAAPIFTNTSDPLAGVRSGLVRRSDAAVTLPLWSPPQPMRTAEGLFYPPSPSFQDRLDAIGPNYHLPILKAAASYVGTHGYEADTVLLKSLLKEAIFGATPGRNKKSDYLNDRYLDRVINGAVRKFSGVRVVSAQRRDVLRRLRL